MNKQKRILYMVDRIVERLKYNLNRLSLRKEMIARYGAISVLVLGLIAGSMSTGFACSPSDTPDEQQADQPATEMLSSKPSQPPSGKCSDLDWAKAAIDAGYVFTTGGVGYSAMSMPVGLRPAEYRNCKNPAQCHGNMPLDMEDRINPWRISTAKADWTVDDPNGKLVYLASDGGIKNLYEETLDASQTHGDFDYTDEDIDVLVDKVEEALSLSDANRVNIIYFSLSIGAADVDNGFYTKMFQALKPYVNSGRLEYKSMNEMYEEYISGL
jgi:hypothetical protein